MKRTTIIAITTIIAATTVATFAIAHTKNGAMHEGMGTMHDSTMHDSTMHDSMMKMHHGSDASNKGMHGKEGMGTMHDSNMHDSNMHDSMMKMHHSSDASNKGMHGKEGMGAMHDSNMHDSMMKMHHGNENNHDWLDIAKLTESMSLTNEQISILSQLQASHIVMQATMQAAYQMEDGKIDHDKMMSTMGENQASMTEHHALFEQFENSLNEQQKAIWAESSEHCQH